MSRYSGLHIAVPKTEAIINSYALPDGLFVTSDDSPPYIKVKIRPNYGTHPDFIKALAEAEIATKVAKIKYDNECEALDDESRVRRQLDDQLDIQERLTKLQYDYGIIAWESNLTTVADDGTEAPITCNADTFCALLRTTHPSLTGNDGILNAMMKDLNNASALLERSDSVKN